jgi:hypothetical protein
MKGNDVPEIENRTCEPLDFDAPIPLRFEQQEPWLEECRLQMRELEWRWMLRSNRIDNVQIVEEIGNYDRRSHRGETGSPAIGPRIT